MLPVSEAPTALYGDGGGRHHDHQLRDDESLTAVRMAAPLDGESAAYFQAITRTLAEWTPVEAIVRPGVTEGTIRFARIAVGGVAPVPLRLERVENALRALHSYDEFDIAIKGLRACHPAVRGYRGFAGVRGRYCT